jgi:hypothetical protein
LGGVERFDPGRRRIAFSTDTVPVIVGALKRHFRDITWPVRVSRRLQDFARAGDRAVWRLSRALGRRPWRARAGRRPPPAPATAVAHAGSRPRGFGAVRRGPRAG